jgi:hypothetical protein
LRHRTCSPGDGHARNVENAVDVKENGCHRGRVYGYR